MCIYINGQIDGLILLLCTTFDKSLPDIKTMSWRVTEMIAAPALLEIPYPMKVLTTTENSLYLT